MAQRWQLHQFYYKDQDHKCVECHQCVVVGDDLHSVDLEEVDDLQLDDEIQDVVHVHQSVADEDPTAPTVHAEHCLDTTNWKQNNNIFSNI